MKTYQSFSSEATQAAGEAAGKRMMAALKKERGRGQKRSGAAKVLALTGELGAGKTTFVQGFFRGVGLRRPAQSPTFILMRRHKVPGVRGANLYHLDVYRLKNESQLGPLHLEEIFADPRNIVLVEWAERIKRALPRTAAWIRFRYGKHENERRLSMQ